MLTDRSSSHHLIHISILAIRGSGSEAIVPCLEHFRAEINQFVDKIHVLFCYTL